MRSTSIYATAAPTGEDMGEVDGQIGTVDGQIGTVGGQIGTVGGQIGTVGGQIGTVGGQIGTVGGLSDVPVVAGRHFGRPAGGHLRVQHDQANDPEAMPCIRFEQLEHPVVI